MTTRRRFVSLLAAGAAFARAQRADAQALPTVKVGILTSATDAPLWIADRLGYFRDEGLNVSFLTFTSGEAMIAPLSTGQLDVAGGSAASSFYNAVARGVDVRIVANLGSDPPGYGFVQVLIRPDLVKNGTYRAAHDLRGLKVSVNAPGSPALPALAKFLARGGLTPDDVKLMYLPYPEHEIALKNGSVDATQTIEPFATDAVKNGVAVKVAGEDQYYPNQDISVLMFGVNLLRRQRELGARFMRGFVRGARFYNDALAGGRLAGRNADRVVDILTAETKMEAGVLRAIVPTGCDPNGALNVASLRDDLAFFKARKFIEGNVAIDAAIDTSFTAEAIRRLGPYRRR